MEDTITCFLCHASENISLQMTPNGGFNLCCQNCAQVMDQAKSEMKADHDFSKDQYLQKAKESNSLLAIGGGVMGIGVGLQFGYPWGILAWGSSIMASGVLRRLFT